MTLILAVEPDPRQASRLSSVLRGRRHTQVVVSKSAERGIEAMTGRVPDVLLTSPLLAPQDEQRLADWLKELGPSAAHVQALTIPILARPGNKDEQQRGLLGGLRGRKRKSAVEGCEPKIFAEHVATYLDQAMADRRDDVIAQPDVMPASEPEPVPEPIAMSAPEPEAVPELAAMPAPEPDDSEESWVPVLLTEEPEAEPVAMLESEVAAPPMAAVPEVREASLSDGAWILSQSPQVVELSDPPVDGGPDAVPLMLLSQPQVLTLPREVVPTAPLEVVFVPPEVITVREDAYEKRVLPPSPAVPAPPPVQDEWGLFDPEKCGFAALLEKLDEITEEERQAHREVEASVRLITHY